MMVILAAVAGGLIGLSLGALGGGGSILAVPVLVYLLGQGPTEATTGSLVVVACTSVIGAVTAARDGRVLLSRGLVFGAVATAGAYLGARFALHARPEVLIASFAILMFVVATLMMWRLHHGEQRHVGAFAAGDPIITFSPTFACQCPQALKLLVTATAVGLLTGFLGVGGGFLVVPALLLALSIPMHQAAGTSLVVITITSLVALAVRTGHGPAPDWSPVVVLTAVSCVMAVVGARWARNLDTRRLQIAFTTLIVVVACYTAFRSIPALVV